MPDVASPAVALPIEHPLDLPDLHIRTVTAFDDFVDLEPVFAADWQAGGRPRLKR